MINFLSSNQWQGWSSPLIGRPKFFWSPRKSKTKKTTKNFGCLNFSHFQSFEHFPFLVIVSLVIDFLFPIKPLFLTTLSRFWFKLALSWPYFDGTLSCVNVQNHVSCCDGLNNAMTTLGRCVHNTFVRSNIKCVGDKNLI